MCIESSLLPISLSSISLKEMGDIPCSINGVKNGNSGGNGNGNGNWVGVQRKSCWYEEEIEENLRWCFAINRYIHIYAIYIYI